jgi:ligand-binding SRPBCC domain-containing protein
MPELRMSVDLAGSVGDVFAFHMDPKNLFRVAPPGVRLTIVDAPAQLAVGTEVTLETRIGPLRFDWTSRIVRLVPDETFVDELIAGPFRRWRHEHLFEPVNDGTRLTDVVTYDVKLGVLSGLAATGILHRHLSWMFRHRQTQMAKLFGALPSAGGSHA